MNNIEQVRKDLWRVGIMLSIFKLHLDNHVLRIKFLDPKLYKWGIKKGYLYDPLKK